MSGFNTVSIAVYWFHCKKWQTKTTYLTVQLIDIGLPAVDQRNLEDLELIFPRVHTPLWAQCTCPGPPRASQRWARRSYGRGAGRAATATTAAHRTNPYFSKHLCRSDYYFSPEFWQKFKLIHNCELLEKEPLSKTSLLVFFFSNLSILKKTSKKEKEMFSSRTQRKHFLYF